MTASAVKYTSERRTEYLLGDLLDAQGWDPRKPPAGDVLLQHEYRAFPELAELLANASKSGEGSGIPEAIIIDRETNTPLAVIEAKAFIEDIDKAKEEAQHYANAIHIENWRPLAIALAGTA